MSYTERRQVFIYPYAQYIKYNVYNLRDFLKTDHQVINTSKGTVKELRFKHQISIR